jgi:hypothetical protein
MARRASAVVLDGDICSPCQTTFEDLFYTYGVDLAIFGHVHISQRFVPVYSTEMWRTRLA